MCIIIVMEELIKTIAPVASGTAIILFALPTYISTLRQKGLLKGVFILAVLGAFVLFVEGLAVKTGIPYGKFEYSSAVGYKFFDLVPWAVAFAFPPILLGSFWGANKITSSVWRIPLTALFALIVEIVVDPALTTMKIWFWETPGQFYGIPLVKFGGWLFVAILGAIILSLLWDDAKVKRGLAFSAFIIVWFWGGVNLGLEQWIPGLLGVIVGFLALLFMYIEKRRDKKENEEIEEENE